MYVAFSFFGFALILPRLRNYTHQIILGIPVRDQGPEEFLEMVAGIQGRRMDDQRAALPCLPGLQHPAQVLGPHIQKRRQQEAAPVTGGDGKTTASAGEKQLEDDFIEMLIRCQVRIE